MHIRQATLQDIKQLTQLNHQVHQLHVEISPETFKQTKSSELTAWLTEQVNDKNRQCFVAETDTKLVGYLTIFPIIRPESPFMHALRYGYLEHLCIDQAFRKQGIAQQLLHKAKQYSQQQSLSYIELDVWCENGIAISAFKKMGCVSSREKLQLIV